MVIVIAVRKMDYFFKQIGGWVDVEIENLPVTASAHGGVERQRWAGAALAEPGLGVLMLQLLFGNEWFDQPRVVYLISVCYMLSIETIEIEVVTRAV